MRTAAAIVFSCLYSSASAQTSVPDLTRQQRELLKAIVARVDAAAAQPETADLQWQHHVLRASDGSHYVAFTAIPPAATPLAPGPVMLYVRVATAPSSGTPNAERSPIREWLAGSRIDPRLLPNNRGIAIGEMPIMGAAGLNTQRPPTSTGGNEMRLMALERERARQEKEDRDKQRRTELEGRAASTRDVLPFEDFSVASHSVRHGVRVISRAVTAGPGDYDLYLAWADPAAPKPAETIRVVRKRLQLEPARTVGLITSSVILADRVTVRDTPYPPAEQASHPYSIGPMEISPASTNRYTPDSNLSVALQVINAQPNDAGMPDLIVNFRVVRVAGDREIAVASLNPQSYNAATLPAGFNLRLGHPIFTAVTAPLASVGRGTFRLKVIVNDRIANAFANTDVDFVVIGTPASLLAEAPSLGQPFQRDVILADALPRVLAAIRPAAASPQLQRAFELASTRRFVELMVEEPVEPNEEGIRAVLRGLSHLAVGDASAAAVQFQRAQLLGAPIATTRLLSGAARAAQSRDGDALAAWQEALAAPGSDRAAIISLMVDAYLRRNDTARAASLLGDPTITPQTPWSRSLAAVLIASRKEDDALRLLESRLAATPDDRDAQWLMLHALFARLTRDPSASRDRFRALARAYIDSSGAHAALAEEWLRAIS